MTDRIDHVAEALRLADLSQHPDTGDPAVGALYIGAAQVHAKLALAEQQRVANLIALWKDDDDAVTLSQAGFSFPATLEEILAGLVR